MEENNTELGIWMASRQQGKAEAMKKFMESLPEGVKVVVIGKDHPRPPFLGSRFDIINYPPMPTIGDAWMGKTPIDYKTAIPIGELLALKTRMTGREESMNGKLLETISKTAQARVDTSADKPNWRKDRMAFLNGLNRKKY